MGRSPALLVGLLALLASMVAPSAASAATTSHSSVLPLPTAVVSLGDSYISGEGGRWEGNHASSYGDRRDTDRAAYRNRWGLQRYSQARVYGDSASGCHRSDVAPLLSSRIEADAVFNLACSGATTGNLVRSANGGRSRKGEPSQADQLASVAAGHDVEMVVVSIGGNDLGFSSIILDCALDYSLSSSWWSDTCHTDQQRRIDRRLPSAMDGVQQALEEIQAVLSEAGQRPGSYRLVLVSYPSPVPRGDDFRYDEDSWKRLGRGGCPFWDVDASWARDTFVPLLADSLAAVAASVGAEFLDLQDALDGREICAEGAAQGVGPQAEWSRFLSTGILQGEAQESLHPNALGQQAIGTCLRLVSLSSPGDYRCANVPGAGPERMLLSTR